jgi:DnaJ-class molecular chaperone
VGYKAGYSEGIADGSRQGGFHNVETIHTPIVRECDFCAGTGTATIDHNGKKLYDGKLGPCPDCKGTGSIIRM